MLDNVCYNSSQIIMSSYSVLTRQVKLPIVSTAHRLLITSLFLVGSVVIAIVLSDDPNWAKWHISYLGEAHTFSADFFNVSMWLSGLVIIWLSMSFRRDLEELQSRGGGFSGVRPLLVQSGLIIMAVCVYLIGLFPRSYGVLPHDIFGHTIYFVFLALCLASPWILPGFKRWFYVTSYAFHAAMLVLFVMYWTDISDSLYLAEVATFVFFLGWLGLLIYESRRK